MYISKCNLRIKGETHLKGSEFKEIPKGLEEYFIKDDSKKEIKRGSKNIETSAKNHRKETR